MALSDLANYIQILGTATAVIVGGFGVVQLLEFRKQHRDTIVAELTRTSCSVDLSDAVALLRTLPDGCSASCGSRHSPFPTPAFYLPSGAVAAGRSPSRRTFLPHAADCIHDSAIVWV